MSALLSLQLRRATQSPTALSLCHTIKRAASTGTGIREAERRVAQVLESQALAKQMPRTWKSGDVYAPHDLTGVEARKWRAKQRPTTDAFDALSINPLTLYKNFAVMSEYVTEMGRIRHSNSTGLRPVNQRKIAKAIRRAVALGLMPSVHRHPEILKREMQMKLSSGGRVR